VYFVVGSFSFRGEEVERTIDLLAAKVLVEEIHYRGPILRIECMAVLGKVHAQPASMPQS
jgi:hypothetical protein